MPGPFNRSLGLSSPCDDHEVGPALSSTFSPLYEWDADMVILGIIGRGEGDFEDDGNCLGWMRYCPCCGESFNMYLALLNMSAPSGRM